MSDSRRPFEGGLRLSLRVLMLCGLVVGSLAPRAATQAADASAVLRAGDRICLVGGALAERLQHDGWLEARLQCRLPELQLSFRNLGFAADELTIHQRTDGFGSQDEWLTRCRATVVLAFFGANESFAGDAGLPKFRADLAAWIAHVQRERYDGVAAPRLVLFSPTPGEERHDRHLPSAAAHNARLAPYVQAMADVAREEGVPFVDLFTPLLADFLRGSPPVAKDDGATGPGPFTTNGIHLNERGNALLTTFIEAALVPRAAPGDARGAAPSPATSGTPGVAAPSSPGAAPSVDPYATPSPYAHPERLAEVRVLVRAKDKLWWNRYRVTDGYNVYGGRSSLSYDGLTNFVVMQRELEILDAQTAQHDERIVAAARGETAIAAAPGGRGGIIVPEPIPVPTNRPGDGPGGEHAFLAGEAAIALMTPAPGMAVNLFADEARFPELANPVQMAWDTRGRLWVAAWPTYPHWAPGDATSDRLLILEDTDGDGRADSCKVFAEDLHNPTGFELWNGGVFVAEAPDLLFLKDTDGDDRADVTERVLGGLNSGDTHHSANSFVIGPDGALYFQEGIFHQSQIETIYGPVRNRDACVWRYEPLTRRVERYAAYGFLNPHGHVFDRWGQDFLTDGTTNENFVAGPMSGYVEEPRKHAGSFTFFAQRSRPAAATEILSSSHFPAENQGNYLIANVIGFQGIFQYRMTDDGAGFSAVEVEPIVHSADPNFRPVDMEVGPDGALYFLDWQAPLIGHMQHHLRDPSRDHSHGRVYRVTCTDRPLLQPEPIAGRPVTELVWLLASPDDRVRYRVRIELSARDGNEVVAAARAWAAAVMRTDAYSGRAAGREHDLLEALWLQEQHGVLDRALLVRVLASPESRARAAAVRVLRHLRAQLADGVDLYGSQPAAPPGVPTVSHATELFDAPGALDLLGRAATDPDPRVRLEVVVACSFFPEARAAEIALAAWRVGHDRFLDYALDETLATLAPQWRAALASGQPLAADDPEALAMLLARLDLAELAGVIESDALYAELLGRHGQTTDRYVAAAASLAQRHGTSAARELLAAIRRADARTDGHVDHLLSGLFEAVAVLPADAQAELAAPMAALAVDARRASTRRLATVARLRADGDVDRAWAAACASPAALIDLLDALPFLHDPALADALFPRLLALLDALPPQLVEDGGAASTPGRFVRVELPGPAHTLTLAEVQVFSRGENVARRGTATQSSTAWSGVAARALDGNTSGTFADEGQTHTAEDRPDPWWELDLGSEQPIERIVLWNRTEDGGRWVSRLDGYAVHVLDDQRRTTFEAHGERATAGSMVLQVGSPAQAVRRAAVAALPALGVREAEAVTALVARFDDEELRGAIVAALRAVPASRWPPAARTALADALLRDFARPDAGDFETDAGRARLALADELVPALRTSDGAGNGASGDANGRGGDAGRADADLAARLAAARERLGPQVIVIRPVPDSLSFDRAEFAVVAGRPVELVFENRDIMPHNLVITAPGALATVGIAGEKLAADPNAAARGWVPDLPEVLHASRLLNPGENQTLSFDAPATPAPHPYVCTFPGHWIRMNGVMHVVRDEDLAATRAGIAARADAAASATAGATAQAAPARKFVRLWTAADFATGLDAVDHASPQRGRAVLEAASCLRCHAIAGAGARGSEGGTTGPELRGVVGRYPRAELLTQLLEPSAVIAKDYGAELFFLRGGGVVSGRVLGEDEHVVRVLDDPYRATPREVPRDEIEERRASEVSVMPDGLLSTLSREEILDLLAYLESLRPSADPAPAQLPSPPHH